MKTFIVIQMQIDSQEIMNNDNNVTMSNIVRKIEAESREIAIGKFVLATQNIKAIKKLKIECYDLSSLSSVV